jgi:hypothetical protein
LFGAAISSAAKLGKIQNDTHDQDGRKAPYDQASVPLFLLALSIILPPWRRSIPGIDVVNIIALASGTSIGAARVNSKSRVFVVAEE